MSIWDEKPKTTDEKYQVDMDYYENYNENMFWIDRDAWLEKVGKRINDANQWERDLDMVVTKLEVIKNMVGDWEKVHQKDRHAALSILTDLEEFLEIKKNRRLEDPEN